MLSAFHLLWCLAQKVLASCKLPIKLVVQIVSVCNDNNGWALQCFLQIVSIKHHGKRLAATLCMPKYATFAIGFGSVFCRSNSFFDCEILVIACQDFECVLSIYIEADKIF